jgi:hypothetical protein
MGLNRWGTNWARPVRSCADPNWPGPSLPTRCRSRKRMFGPGIVGHPILSAPTAWHVQRRDLARYPSRSRLGIFPEPFGDDIE